VIKKPFILIISLLLLIPLAGYAAEGKAEAKPKAEAKKEKKQKEKAPKEPEKKEIKEYKHPEDMLRVSVPPYNKPGLGVLFSYQDKLARQVSVVGDFNNWNPIATRMKKNSFGVWEVLVPLDRGNWSYKYNVDGQWILDPKNFKRVSNDQGDLRSVVTVKTDFDHYFRPLAFGYVDAAPPRHLQKGIEFTYKDIQAEQVSVAGDFNNWNKQQYPLKMNKKGIWSVTVPLDKGRFRYKFFVDGLWVRDPSNPDTALDEYGGTLSLLAVTNDFVDSLNAPHPIDRIPWKFTYFNKNIPSRYKIAVIGDFNAWEPGRDLMSDPDQDKVWTAVVYLRPGSYLYRFRIGDEEFTDPYNHKVKKTADGKDASFIEVFQPPERRFIKFTFRPATPLSAKKVFLAGDFNNWDLENTPLEFDAANGYWYATVDLPRGVYKYRFFYEGKWSLDLSNPDIVIDQNRETYSVVTVK
jgi:1,4-alpha-glucan branching enzyme